MALEGTKEKKGNLKPEYYWFILFAFTFIAYQMVQDYWRPNYRGDSALIKYLLGIAPNFFPAVGIPALFVIIIPELNKKNTSNKWLTTYKHLTANIISLLGLLSWEFMQIGTARGRFDWNDVLWTFMGALVFQFIWSITPAHLRKKKEEELIYS